MKLIEKYLNILHYCLYIIDYKMHLLANRVNPSRLLYKIPAIKRKNEQQGIDLNVVVNQFFGDKRFGLSVIIAGGVLWGTFSFWFISLLIILYAVINKSYLPIFYFWVCGGISGLISYVFVFRHDKYLKYFKKYDKWTKKERYYYCTITLLYLLFIICIFFGALNFSGYIIRNW